MKSPDSTVEGENGWRALEDEDFPATDSAVRWAVGLDPSNPIHTHAAATTALKAGRRGEAEILFRRAMSDTVRTFGPSHPHMVTVASGLADLYEAQGRFDEARRLCEAIVAGVDLKVAEMANSRTLKRFAGLCRRAGVPQTAIALYQRAVPFRRRLYGASHPIIAEYLAGFAELLDDLGDHANAARARKRAADLSRGPVDDRSGPPNPRPGRSPRARRRSKRDC